LWEERGRNSELTALTGSPSDQRNPPADDTGLSVTGLAFSLLVEHYAIGGRVTDQDRAQEACECLLLPFTVVLRNRREGHAPVTVDATVDANSNRQRNRTA
ncbi:unnamed protein product, partial [Ectocarpus fasciculatus]